MRPLKPAYLAPAFLCALAAAPVSAALIITEDLAVPSGSSFTLRVRSELPKGSRVTWQQESGPVWLLRRARRGETITLKSRWTGKFVFLCTAHIADGPVEQKKVSVTVTPGIRQPVAKIAGPLTRTVGAGEWVYLSGENSYDPLGRPLEYYWARVSGPTAQVKRGTGRKPLLEFMPQEPGRYVFSLQVKTGRDVSDPQVTVVEVPVHPNGGPDHSPVLAVSAPASAVVDRKTRLDASKSSDPDGDTLKIEWQILSAPNGANIEGSKDAVFEFTPTCPGQYRFLVSAQALRLSEEKEILLTAATSTTDTAPLTPTRPAISPQPAKDGLISVDWSTVTLQEALGELSRRYSVMAVIAPAWLKPSQFERIYLDLRMKDVPTDIAVTWLARSLGGHYHKQAPNRFWLDDGYGYLREETREAFSAMLGPAFDRIDDRSAWFEGAVKPAILASGRTDLLNIKGNTVSAVLPGSAVKRLNAVTAAASTRALIYSFDGRPSCPGLDRSVKIEYDGEFLRDILWNLGEQAGVNVGFRCQKLPGAGRKAVTAHLGEKTLREALRWAMKEAGLSVINIDAEDCVWLDKEEVLPPGGTLWDTADVAAFELSGVLKEGRITPSLVSHLIQKRVCTAAWKDPASALLYLPKLQRLVAVNHPWVLAEVEQFLEGLRRLDYRFWKIEE